MTDKPSTTELSHTVRCAIYTRSASDQAESHNIQDQEQDCRAAAEMHPGWVVLNGHIYNDAGVSGATLADRKGLDSLLGDAKKNPRPFDRVLVADSSRISRNIRHALRYIDVLALHSVHVYFVSHKLSSENPHFKMMMTMCGVLEEQYTAAHAENVRRGQKGKVLLGYTVGSNSFGYTSVAHRRSSSKAGESGIPVLRGHRLEIIESQAAVIRRIYRMFLDGHTASQIMKTPNIIRT